MIAGLERGSRHRLNRPSDTFSAIGGEGRDEGDAYRVRCLPVDRDGVLTLADR